MLPPSTNKHYAGSRLAVWFLTVFAFLTIIPGCIHTFLPDGGAGVIAGLDLSQNSAQVISLFAWAGTTQIVWGLMLLVISLHYRALTPLTLGLLLLERCLHAWNMWGPKGSIDGHHPPEAWITLIIIPLVALFFWLSLKDKQT